MNKAYWQTLNLLIHGNSELYDGVDGRLHRRVSVAVFRNAALNASEVVARTDLDVLLTRTVARLNRI